MSSVKREAMVQFLEGLVETDLTTPTHSDWAVPSILVPKKFETYRLILDYHGRNEKNLLASSKK